jgi:preprotein translocase subunit YajC
MPLAAATGQPSVFVGLLPLVLIFAIFYFLIIAPQRKRQRKLQEMVNELKKGDQVITNGGIHGRVVRAEEGTVTLAVAQNVEIKVSRGAIAGLQDKDSA